MTGGVARRGTYFLCTHLEPPQEIDLDEYKDTRADLYLTYWVRVLRELEARSSLAGYTFYLVWHYRLVPDLPSYGDDVVAILLMDEGWVVPHYLHRVGFVFKTYGFRPWLNLAWRGMTPAVLLKFAKDCAIWMAHQARFLARNRALPAAGRGMVAPLGYALQTDLPGKPFETRRYFVGFLGSVEQNPIGGFSPRALLGTPKSNARARMAAVLRRLEGRRPGEVFYGATGSYNDSILAGGARYTEVMADTKISLAPRGSSVETYRFFEAMRQGCVVICDRLPPHWFYAGSPAIEIDDWGELESVVESLQADPQRLAELHRASLAWWQDKLSERAVAGVLAGGVSKGKRLLF